MFSVDGPNPATKGEMPYFEGITTWESALNTVHNVFQARPVLGQLYIVEHFTDGTHDKVWVLYRDEVPRPLR